MNYYKRGSVVIYIDLKFTTVASRFALRQPPIYDLDHAASVVIDNVRSNKFMTCCLRHLHF